MTPIEKLPDDPTLLKQMVIEIHRQAVDEIERLERQSTEDIERLKRQSTEDIERLKTEQQAAIDKAVQEIGRAHV